MNMQRITISLPQYLYEELVRGIPPRKISRFVRKAVEKELMRETDPIEEFIEFKERLPKRRRIDIFRAIRKGRV